MTPEHRRPFLVQTAGLEALERLARDEEANIGNVLGGRCSKILSTLLDA